LYEFVRAAAQAVDLSARSKQLSLTARDEVANMPMLMLRNDTMHQVKAKRPPGFQLTGPILRCDDGGWLVSVNDDVTMRVAQERVLGESDDGVVSRLLLTT
jgi:hypothetical protein